MSDPYSADMDIGFIALTLAAAITVRDPILGSEPGLRFSRDLLWSNRSGSFDRTERAAFIVAHTNGDIECVAWPATYERESAKFSGVIPPGTVAIIHTHPINAPWVSEKDEKEAHRLGIAIYALTPMAITKAVPSQDGPVMVRKGKWLDPPPRDHPCRL